MAGTKEGAKQAAQTIKDKYGPDYYKRTGRMGGMAKRKRQGGFAVLDKELLREISAKGAASHGEVRLKMFNKPRYSAEDLTNLIDRLEKLDRLRDKAEQHYRLNGKTDEAKHILEGYTTALLVAQKTLAKIMERAGK